MVFSGFKKSLVEPQSKDHAGNANDGKGKATAGAITSAAWI
jgi:hypothetical protein